MRNVIFASLLTGAALLAQNGSATTPAPATTGSTATATPKATAPTTVKKHRHSKKTTTPSAPAASVQPAPSKTPVK